MFTPDKSLMRSESGQKYTRRLFLETSYDVNDKSNTLYTLRDDDHPSGYKSLYRLYMDEADLTEHSFANKYLLGWAHWQAICTSDWFIPYVTRWREELRLAKRSLALQTIEDELTKDKPLEAAKALLAITAPPKEAKKAVGRPQKDKIVDIESQTEFMDDFSRINAN